MKWHITILIALIAGFITACDKNDPGTDSNTAQQEQPQAETHSDHEAGEDHEAEEKLITFAEAKNLGALTVEPAAVRELTWQISVPGTVRSDAYRLVHVTPLVSGRLVKVLGLLGNSVKQGESLAVLDSRELGLAQADYLTALSEIWVAKQAYERAKTLIEDKVIAPSEFQRREGLYKAAKTKVQIGADKLRILGMDREAITRLQSDQTIHTTTIIRSPMQGVITKRHATIGEIAGPDSTLFVVTDLTTVWTIASLPEKELRFVSTGTSVTVSVSAYPDREFTGTVTYISDEIDPATRTVSVRAEVPNSDRALKPEMFARMQIDAAEPRRILAIPKEAIFLLDNASVVFIKGVSGYMPRQVQASHTHGNWVEIHDGLTAGEEVVVSGGFSLKALLQKEAMGEGGHGH